LCENIKFGDNLCVNECGFFGGKFPLRDFACFNLAQFTALLILIWFILLTFCEQSD